MLGGQQRSVSIVHSGRLLHLRHVLQQGYTQLKCESYAMQPAEELLSPNDGSTGLQPGLVWANKKIIIFLVQENRPLLSQATGL